MSFEVRRSDLAGRIGKIETLHGILETPVFVPVVHPIRQVLSTQTLKRIGFEAIITNAYIALKHCGDEARRRGIHSIVDYDGIVMTDSGGYQVLEYGDINIDAGTMAQFEIDIKSDIAVPLDRPTGIGLTRKKAETYVERTLENAKKTLELIDRNSNKTKLSHITEDNSNTRGQIWAGPIQGAEYSDLVSYSAWSLDKMGFKHMALGSPVEAMEKYEFPLLTKMIAAAKRVVPTKPLHLFGAGHPLTLPLIVALGCDIFDSASYMLYARESRYMHANGTIRLDDLSYLPCYCPVCSNIRVEELLRMDKDERTLELAKHNLHVMKAEVSAVKQAIVNGRLWEYVMQKARSHPKLMEAVYQFKDLEFLDDGTPQFKNKAIFLFEPLDQYRPEVKRFRRLVSSLRLSINKVKKTRLILYPDSNKHPFYSTSEFLEIVKRFPNAQICTYNRFLGVIPVEISDIFPAAHNLSVKGQKMKPQTKDYPAFTKSLEEFLTKNVFEEIIIIADDFINEIIECSPTIRALNTIIHDYKTDITNKL